MSRAKQASKGKRTSKAVPVLGAAGLLSLVSGAPAATAATTADVSAPNTGANRETSLREEEISDVSLATFYVFDKESDATSRPRGLAGRLAMGACNGCGGCGGCGCGFAGCWTGTYYTSSVFGGAANPPAIAPAHKHAHAHKHTAASKKP